MTSEKYAQANEDSFILNEPIGLFVVADGMGGHRGGGVASRIAVEAIDAYMAASAQELSGTGGTDTPDDRSSDAKRLLHSIAIANQKIYEQSISDKACRGMGTTVSALYLSGNSIITANVGDSPIYLLRNGEIETLYTPHTLLHERKKNTQIFRRPVFQRQTGTYPYPGSWHPDGSGRRYRGNPRLYG